MNIENVDNDEKLSQDSEIENKSPLNGDISSLNSILQDVPSAPEIMVKSEDVPKVMSNEEIKISLKNRELILTRLDDLLITSGVRLTLFLPLLVLVMLGLAQTFRNSDPIWWDQITQNALTNSSFVSAIYALSLVIMIANLMLLFILHYLLWVTHKIFQLETDEITKSGVTFKSAHGYAEMKAVISGASRQLNFTTTLMILSTVLLGASFWFSTEEGIPYVEELIALSTGALLSGQGVYLVSNRPRMNTVKPWGLLDAFSPPIHPALLDKPFTDVIRPHVDPMLAVRLSKYVSSFSDNLKSGITLSTLQENLLQYLHMHRTGLIDEEEFRKALVGLIDSKTLDKIFNHSELGEETLDRLLMHARNRCAPFFRLHDRLRAHLSSENNSDIWFDVDMENLTLGQANLFSYVLNNGTEARDVIIRIQTPDFRPNECVYRLRINPHTSDGKFLFFDLKEAVMNSGIIWHSLIPSTMGEATVTVRLEDVEGNLLSGKVLTVQVRSDLLTRIRMTTGALFMIGAGLAILSPIIPFISSLLGL